MQSCAKMLRVRYPALATGRVWLISYLLRLSHMGIDVGQIFTTASLHRDHSILNALVCDKTKPQPEGPPLQWETMLADLPTERRTRGLGFLGCQ